jgi:hypothetical protein
MPTSPKSLAVSPRLVEAAGERLRLSAEAPGGVAPHYRGPQQSPPIGDARCTAAYETAHQSLGGVVTAAVNANQELSAALQTAGIVYATLDVPRPRSSP